MIKFADKPFDLDELLNIDAPNIGDTNLGDTNTTIGDTNLGDTNTTIGDTNLGDTNTTIGDTNLGDTKNQELNKNQKLDMYKKEHYDTIRINFPIGAKTFLKSEAEKRGMSMTRLIKTALKEYLENND